MMFKCNSEDISSLIRNVCGLVTELCRSEDEDQCFQLTEQLIEVSEQVQRAGQEKLKCLGIEQQIQMRNSAFNLWNFAIAKKNASTITDLWNAKIRHLACNIAFTTSLTNSSYAVLKRYTSMAAAAGRTWLDYGDSTMAEQCLNLAMQALKELQRMLGPTSSPVLLGGDHAGSWQRDLDEGAFKIYCYMAEKCATQGNHKIALEWISHGKGLLNSVPEEQASLLAILCYNCGFDALENKKYESSVAWLRESYELGKQHNTLEGHLLAKILRLLATSYVEWDPAQYCQKALNAVGLANAEHCHPTGLHLKLRILLLSDSSDPQLQAAVDELLSHPELNADLGIQTVRLLAGHDRLPSAVTTCGKLLAHFKDDPTSMNMLKVLQIELMIKDKQFEAAKTALEQCFKGPASGVDFGSASLKQLHSLLWEQAAAAYGTSDSSDALMWYNYSFRFFTHHMEMESTNVAKLQRNRASCFLNLQRYTEAEEAVLEAMKHEPANPYSQYLMFKVGLYNEDHEKAVTALKQMCEVKTNGCLKEVDVRENQEMILSLISLAAQQAFEKSNQAVAIQALEKLAEHTQDHTQTVNTYRCLIRLRCSNLEQRNQDSNKEAEIIWGYLKSVFECLHTLVVEAEVQRSTKSDADWFMKIAWNLAIEHSESSELTHKFFSICAQFCGLDGADPAILGRQKTCLVMAAASCLQVARECEAVDQMRSTLDQVLEHVQKCKDVYHKMNPTSGSSGDRALVLLLLYEFESLTKLGRTAELDLFLTGVLGDGETDIKTLETLAALGMEPPARYPGLSRKLLEAAIQKHLQAAQLDVSKFSKSLHNLIQLNLGDGPQPDEESKERAWTAVSIAMDVIRNKLIQSEYPEAEIQWLMTKVWNIGIHAFSGGRYPEAGKWCGMGLQIMEHLTSLKSCYETKMQALCEEISIKVNEVQEGNLMEE